MRPPIPLDRCLHPVRVVSGDGSVSYYPCGSCDSCQQSHASRWRSRLFCHFNSGKRTAVFITLTYSNKHLPIVHLDPNDPNKILYISRTKLCSGSTDRFKRVICNDTFTSSNSPYVSTFNNPLIRDYFSSRLDDGKSLIYRHIVKVRKSNSIIYDKEPRFAICLKKDVQDFIKRFRIALSRDSRFASFDTRFEYFVCSEYGPETFRPHYHGIFFFRSSALARLLDVDFILQVWQKSGNLSKKAKSECFKRINSASGVASYVSQYVTSDSSLPFSLKVPAFRPFHLQSKSIAIGSEAFDPESIPSMFEKACLTFHVEYFDKESNEYVSYDSPYPGSSFRRLFPRFKFSSLIDNSTLARIFYRICSFESESDFPDYVSTIVKKYGIGSIRSEYVHVRRPFRYFYKPEKLYRIDTMTFRIAYELRDSAPVVSSYSVYKPVYSDFVTDLFSNINDPNDSFTLDLFVFGLPENLTAARKIHRAFRRFSWTKDVQSYINYYKRYFSIVSSQRLLNQYNYVSQVLDVTSCQFDPTIIPILYPSFYEKLPKTIESFSSEDYDRADDICYNRFGFNVVELYDSEGRLRLLENSTDQSYKRLYRQYLHYRRLKFDKSRKYKYSLSDIL